jgi:hypothetical protein
MAECGIPLRVAKSQLQWRSRGGSAKKVKRCPSNTGFACCHASRHSSFEVLASHGDCFNPSIAHQTHCRSEAVVEAPIWSRAKHMPNEGRRLGANHEEPRMTITPTTVPEPGGARLRRAMGAGRRKTGAFLPHQPGPLPQPVSASSTGSVT